MFEYVHHHCKVMKKLEDPLVIHHGPLDSILRI